MEMDIDQGDKQLESFVIALKGETWDTSQENLISSTLSNDFTNKVQIQALYIINKLTLESSEKTTKLLQNLVKSKVLNRIAELITEDSVNTAEMSSSIFINLATHANEFLDLYLPFFLQQIKNLTTKENYDILRLRLLFLIAKISAVSEEAFQKTIQFGCLPEVISVFDIEDVLEVLNVVEIFQIVGSTVFGLDYLIEKNIAKQIIEFIAKEDDDAGGLLRDKCLSWALSISRNPNTQLILLDTLPLVESLDSYFLNGNPVCCDDIYEVISLINLINAKYKVDGIIVVGAIGTTERGLEKIFAQENLLSNVLSYLNQGVEIKICVLSAITEIFEKRLTTSENEIAYLQKLYATFSSETDNDLIVYLSELLKTPYLELRIAVYTLFQGLVRYSFCIEKITATPGFLDYLLTRDKEPEYEGNTWKFVIFQKLVEHPKGKEILGSFQYLNCIEYLKRGIFWKKTENSVQIEDSHL